MDTEQRVEKVEYDVTVLKQDVAILTRDVAELKVDVKELKKDVTGLKVDVAAIKAQLVHMVTHADINKLLMGMMVVGASTLISIFIGVLNYIK